MEAREMEIRRKAEEIVQGTLSLPKRLLFNWVLFHARRGNDIHYCYNYCLLMFAH